MNEFMTAVLLVDEDGSWTKIKPLEKNDCGLLYFSETLGICDAINIKKAGIIKIL